MSETPSERQTGINKDGGAQVRCVETNSRTPGSRSLQAGGEFLKALASDLGAVASLLRLLLIAKHQRKWLPHASATRRISWGSVCGRVFRFVSITLFGLVSASALALSGFALWLVFGIPDEPRSSDADALRLQFEARKSESIGHIGPLKTGEPSRQGVGREPGAQGRSGADVRVP